MKTPQPHAGREPGPPRGGDGAVDLTRSEALRFHARQDRCGLLEAALLPIGVQQDRPALRTGGHPHRSHGFQNLGKTSWGCFSRPELSHLVQSRLGVQVGSRCSHDLSEKMEEGDQRYREMRHTQSGLANHRNKVHERRCDEGLLSPPCPHQQPGQMRPGVRCRRADRGPPPGRAAGTSAEGWHRLVRW